jgi:arginine utilization protein RocB
MFRLESGGVLVVYGEVDLERGIAVALAGLHHAYTATDARFVLTHVAFSFPMHSAVIP